MNDQISIVTETSKVENKKNNLLSIFIEMNKI